jgi:hypothetical protein
MRTEAGKHDSGSGPPGPALITLNTHELRLGDIVHESGMRVHLSREPHIETRQRIVYAWVGDVLNPEETIAYGMVPRAFLGEHRWHPERGWVWEQTNQWTVQGNDLARWAVERHEQ